MINICNNKIINIICIIYILLQYKIKIIIIRVIPYLFKIIDEIYYDFSRKSFAKIAMGRVLAHKVGHRQHAEK